MPEGMEMEKLQQAVCLLLDRVKNQLEDDQTGVLTSQAVKHYASTLKDIRELLRQEQGGNDGILVEMSKELEEYSS